MNRKIKLATWEIGSVLWIAVAGSMLHFAFELSDYWEPMALMGAVNESAWEHVKMYFWPGLAFTLVQYTYTRDIANNYWFGKSMALAATPLVIFISYFGYMEFVAVIDAKPSLAIMIGVMIFGIAFGQLTSYLILSQEPLAIKSGRYALVAYATLILMFSTFTYYPPRAFVFENFFCYQYTGEYGILKNYEPYRVFAGIDENGNSKTGGGVNYCETFKTDLDQKVVEIQ